MSSPLHKINYCHLAPEKSVYRPRNFIKQDENAWALMPFLQHATPCQYSSPKDLLILIIYMSQPIRSFENPQTDTQTRTAPIPYPWTMMMMMMIMMMMMMMMMMMTQEGKIIDLVACVSLSVCPSGGLTADELSYLH